MKAIILARISSKDQEDGQSISSQTRRMKEYAKRKDFLDQKIFEITESSTKDTRKKFEKVIEEIKSSKELTILIVETIDRLQRGFKESVELDDLRKEGILELHFLRENLILDKDSNSSDLLRWDMGVMFARSYVLQLSDNVKRSIEQKLRNGEWPGKAPVGYKNITNESKERVIVVDQERAFLIKKLFELYATGNYSMKKLAKEMRKRGLTSYPNGNPTATAQVQKILRNPFYYGEMEMKKKRYIHKYTPIISRHLFEKVQKVIDSYNRQNFKRTNKPYIFRGLIQCSYCGCAITPEPHKGHVYYHCTNYHEKHKKGEVDWIREEDLLSQVKNTFKDLGLSNEATNKLKEELLTIHESEKDYYENNVDKIKKSIDRIGNRLSVMYKDRLDGRITMDEYDKMASEYKKEQQDLLLQLEDHTNANYNFYITASKLLDVSRQAWELFEGSEVEEKQQIINFVLQNFSLKGRKLLFELKTPFNGIVEYAKSGKWCPGQDSNLRPTA